MRYLLTLLIVISFSFVVCSQEVISTQGDRYSNSYGMIDFTIGEPVIETFEAENTIITQGFHQTKLELVGISELVDQFEISVNPNPVAYHLMIDIPDIYEKYTAVVYDLNSKNIYRQDIIDEMTSIDFSSFSSGSYILIIRNSHNLILRSFKIQKI